MKPFSPNKSIHLQKWGSEKPKYCLVIVKKVVPALYFLGFIFILRIGPEFACFKANLKCVPVLFGTHNGDVSKKASL